MIGTKLAHYEITAHIGSGGMGEVYQATDTKLGRTIAIKVLPQEFARDPERVARLQRETRVLASLNHSNIATLHGWKSRGTDISSSWNSSRAKLWQSASSEEQALSGMR